MWEVCIRGNSAHYARWCRTAWRSLCLVSKQFTKPAALWQCKDSLGENSTCDRHQQDVQSAVCYRSLNQLAVSATTRTWRQRSAHTHTHTHTHTGQCCSCMRSAASESEKICDTTFPVATRTIMRRDVTLYPCKIQVVQMLTAANKQRRRDFCRDSTPHLTLSVCDEAHFFLDGFMNKHNTGLWASQNPHRLVETSLCLAKCTMWCAFSKQGTIGPNSVEDNVTSQQCLQLFGSRDLSNHFVERFECGWSWPPCSPDMNRCDCFLWGCVYRTNPRSSELASRDGSRCFIDHRWHVAWHSWQHCGSFTASPRGRTIPYWTRVHMKTTCTQILHKGVFIHVSYASASQKITSIQYIETVACHSEYLVYILYGEQIEF
jgi:hypothetical protein